MGIKLTPWLQNEWVDTTWGELVELKYGKALKDYKGKTSGHPVFGTNGPVGFNETPLCDFPSVIIGRKGAYRGVHYSEVPFYVIDTAYFVVPKFDINLRWAYYELLQQDINGLDSGSAIPSTRREDFYALRVKVPPRFIQDGIANLLDSFNNKITLNRQINQTLEQMAQTLFKSWFVDFDPVMDNALDAGNPVPDELQHRAEVRKAVRESESFKPLPDDVRQLFPNAFEESELGWVPKGWGISSVSEISEILNGFAFKSGDYATSGQFVLRTKNFENGEVARANDDVFLPDSFLDSHKKYLCEPYDYHLVMVGASVGKCAMIFPHQLPALRNQNMWCFRAKKNSRAHQSYVKYMLDMLVSKSIGLASGSAREFFRKGDFGNQKVCVGDELIQSQFQLICSKWTEKKAKNAEQLDSLTKLRDTLLPKLISGELRLDDVEVAVEQETVSA